MSSIDPIRLLRRVDVRLTATLIAIFGPIIAAALFLSHAYAAHELMEEIGRSLEAEGVHLREAWARAPAEREEALRDRARETARLEAGFWVLDHEYRIVFDGAPTLRARRSWDPEPLWNALRIQPGDAILRSFDLDPRHRAMLVAGAEHFVVERLELAGGFWISLVCGLLAAAAAALLAARVALDPLRQTTADLEDIDAADLGIRLADRGTEDDVDRHARALNRVLQRLDEGFARLRAFSSDVAHELRTPVNRVLNRAEIAALDAPRGSPEQEVLLEIRSSTEELSRLITSLLLLAQADARHLPMTMERIDVRSLFETLRELYGAVAQERGVELQLALAAGVELAVDADRTLLLRALANLIDNAIRVAPHGTSVFLRAAHAGGEVRIDVEDAGPGIDQSQRERVFDRFVRLDRSAPGSGLGLAIARAVVEAHGGRIAARPGGDCGTVMRISLPLASER